MQQYPSYPPPMMPPPTPKPPSNRTLWIILGSLGGLIIVCCVIGGIVLLVNGSGSPNALAGTTATPAETPLPTATPKPKKWVVVQTFSGNGDKKTVSFTINANDWRLIWTCNPASSFGGSYNVVVSVDESDGSFGGDPSAINTICQAGNTAGTTEEHNVTGLFYLDVISEGTWTIKVEVFE